MWGSLCSVTYSVLWCVESSHSLRPQLCPPKLTNIPETHPFLHNGLQISHCNWGINSQSENIHKHLKLSHRPQPCFQTLLLRHIFRHQIFLNLCLVLSVAPISRKQHRMQAVWSGNDRTMGSWLSLNLRIQNVGGVEGERWWKSKVSWPLGRPVSRCCHSMLIQIITAAAFGTVV